MPGIGDTDQAEVHCEMEQLQVNLIDEEEVDVKAVRELNALESDELKPGRKLLLVKGL